MDKTIDEHFRKSLDNDYNKLTGGFLTPDRSSLNVSPIEEEAGKRRQHSKIVFFIFI